MAEAQTPLAARGQARKVFGAESPPPGGFLARVGSRVVAVLSSYSLVVALLVYLMILTFLGTFQQQWMSLYDVQAKYFEEPIFLQRVGPLRIPMLGAVVVLVILGLNLLVGGLIRIRKGRATWFVLVIHVGILLLLSSGLVEYLTSRKGYLKVYEGGVGSTFQSHFEWEIVVRERKTDGAATDHVFGAEELVDLGPADTARFTSSRLPFDVAVTAWARNSEPAEGGGRETEGLRLRPLPPELQAEANLPGALVTLQPKASDERVHRTWLWGGPYSKVDGTGGAPWVVDAGGRTFEIDLRQQTWDLPFAVLLKDFVHRRHPGTDRPAQFSSYVTKVEGAATRDVHITMNEPLRHAGHTLYQSGWGPQEPANLPPGTRMYSVFSVVHNPSDQWPKYSCIVIAFGLICHFLWKLFRFITADRSRRAAAARSAA